MRDPKDYRGIIEDALEIYEELKCETCHPYGSMCVSDDDIYISICMTISDVEKHSQLSLREEIEDRLAEGDNHWDKPGTKIAEWIELSSALGQLKRMVDDKLASSKP